MDNTTAEVSCFARAYHFEYIASGIAYGKYYPQMLKFLENNLPCDKDVFFYRGLNK